MGTGKCDACENTNTLTCSDATTATKCKPGFGINSKKCEKCTNANTQTCVTDKLAESATCDVGYGVNSKKCEKCTNPNTATCKTDTLAESLTCLPGFYLKAKKCEACAASGKICESDTSDVTCAEGYAFNGTTKTVC